MPPAQTAGAMCAASRHMNAGTGMRPEQQQIIAMHMLRTASGGRNARLLMQPARSKQALLSQPQAMQITHGR